jgi:hypothetical protein
MSPSPDPAAGRAGRRWLAAVAGAIVIFLGLDQIGGSPGLLSWLPQAGWLPVVSPVLAGAAAAWGAGRGALLRLAAALAAVWGRIGVDLGIGALRGVHLPPEAVIVLVAGFWVPWSLAALGGGAAVVLARWALRSRAPRRG